MQSRPSRLARNVNKHQEFMWKLGGYINQFYFVNKLAVWEPGYNFRESSNSPLHGPDWTHFNEKMPVPWNWLIPYVFLFPVHYVYLWAFPPRLLLEKETQHQTKDAHVASKGPCWAIMLGVTAPTLHEDLQSPESVCWSSAPELQDAVPCILPAFWKLPAFQLHPNMPFQ